MNNQLVIIGGMGPQASLKLHEYLIRMSDATAPDEYPAILHASLPVPDFISSPQNMESAIAIIQTACSQLPLQTATIGMSCNTAHLLLDRLTNIPQDQFVSMIKAVGDDIEMTGHKKIGLLASPTTIRSGLYHRELEERGLDIIQPEESDFRALESIIRDVISGLPTIKLRSDLSALAKKLEEKGAEVILLGCTELPLVGVDSKKVVIDSLSSLAKHMLQKASEQLSIDAASEARPPKQVRSTITS